MWKNYLNFALLVTNIILCLIKYKRLTKPQRIIGLALLITLIAELYAFSFMVKAQNNLFIFHFLVPVQYILYSLVFFFLLHSKKLKRFILLSIIFVPVASYLSAIIIQTTTEYNSYVTVVKHFLLTLWILLYFKQILEAVEIENLIQEPTFWSSTGLLFYSLGNFFIEGAMNFLIKTSMPTAKELYFVSVLLGLFMYILFLISFSVGKK